MNLVTKTLLNNAFPEDKKGKLKIKFESKDHGHILTISDNGVGIPAEIEPEKTESLGLQLVNNLTNQIEGEIVLGRGYGTKFEITFEELEYKERF